MDAQILQKVRRALEDFIQKEALGGEQSIEISFMAPNMDFVADLGARPMINCYLIGVNEDRNRRKSEPYHTAINDKKTTITLQREPKFVDISYMLTVWYKNKKSSAEIEHLIMGYLISGLGKYDFLPDSYIKNYQINPGLYGIKFTLFGSENGEKISGQVWQAMGSTPKPSLMMSLSVPIDVHPETTLPIIQAIDRALSKKST